MDTLLTYQVFSHSAETHLQVFALLVIGFALGRFLPFLLRPIFRRIGGASGQTYAELMTEALRAPSSAVGLVLAGRISGVLYSEGSSCRVIMAKVTAVATIGVIAWVVSRLWRALTDRVLAPLSRSENPTIDPMVLPVLRRLVLGTVWLIAFVSAASELDYNVMTLLTGLGIGGLAVALAAKDTLSPMVGGMAIFLTRPFRVGDQIEAGSDSGVVLEIGLRATVLLRAGGRVIVPNDKLINSTIRNNHSDGASQLSFDFGLPYGLAAEDLKRVCDAVVAILPTLPTVDAGRGHCRVIRFGGAAVEMRVCYWLFEPAVQGDAQHHLALGIKELLDAAKIEIPYPTTVQLVGAATVHAPALEVLTARTTAKAP